MGTSSSSLFWNDHRLLSHTGLFESSRHLGWGQPQPGGGSREGAAFPGLAPANPAGCQDPCLRLTPPLGECWAAAPQVKPGLVTQASGGRFPLPLQCPSWVPAPLPPSPLREERLHLGPRQLGPHVVIAGLHFLCKLKVGQRVLVATEHLLEKGCTGGALCATGRDGVVLTPATQHLSHPHTRPPNLQG